MAITFSLLGRIYRYISCFTGVSPWQYKKMKMQEFLFPKSVMLNMTFTKRLPTKALPSLAKKCEVFLTNQLSMHSLSQLSSIWFSLLPLLPKQFLTLVLSFSLFVSPFTWPWVSGVGSGLKLINFLSFFLLIIGFIPEDQIKLYNLGCRAEACFSKEVILLLDLNSKQELVRPGVKSGDF